MNKPGNTPAVLKALAEQCTKAVFFPIGKHAMWHPEILKQVADAFLRAQSDRKCKS
jgi:peptidoglycan/xylan/chitin deacetylase (PgdA/CDA1 family)